MKTTWLKRYLKQCFCLLLFAIATYLFVGCSSSRLLTGLHTQLARDASRDTIYLSDVRYDSIYIYRNHTSEYHRDHVSEYRIDTLFVKDTHIEYRFRLLRDTIRQVRHDSILIVQRDSIPYEVTVKEIKEVSRPLTWFDHLTRITFWLLVGLLLMKFYSFWKRPPNN